MPDAATLQAWVRRSQEHDVPHSGPVESEFGVHLNLRAPDSFPVELFVLTPTGAARLGLAEEVSAPA